ncbi:MAG: hypothetical protein QG670_2036, partial [Thermoproteota archaeon]|nr:hypothetical protein [Thermoproteota archaeon]
EAFISGRVTEVILCRKAVIETSAALINEKFGVGGEVNESL